MLQYKLIKSGPPAKPVLLAKVDSPAEEPVKSNNTFGEETINQCIDSNSDFSDLVGKELHQRKIDSSNTDSKDLSVDQPNINK